MGDRNDNDNSRDPNVARVQVQVRGPLRGSLAKLPTGFGKYAYEIVVMLTNHPVAPQFLWLLTSDIAP